MGGTCQIILKVYKIQNVKIYVSSKVYNCIIQNATVSVSVSVRRFPLSASILPLVPQPLPDITNIRLSPSIPYYHCYIFVRLPSPSTKFIFWTCLISLYFDKLCIYFFWLKSIFGICFLSLKLPPTDSLCPPLDSPMENSNLSFTMKFRG